MSMLFIPPDELYLDYFDWKTLGCLFCVLAVASAFRRAGAFEYVALSCISHIHKPLNLTLVTLLVTAIFSMAFTNDVALIIMLPLSTAMCMKLNKVYLIPLVFSLQTLTANLCGMITPFGNPQNLYLFSYYHVSLEEFFSTMAFPFVLSTLGIFVVAVIGVRSKEAASAPEDTEANEKELQQTSDNDQVKPLSKRARSRMTLYGFLFLLALLAVFRFISYLVAVIAIALSLAVVDRKALARVDYGLLATFLCFFVFAGNMARIPALEEWLSPLMNDWGLLVSALTSQVISNVPAAVVLSHFTNLWQPLLVGVNIGGAGTFVGSLASLITIRFFMIARKELLPQKTKDSLSTKRFIVVFGTLNMAFLIVLLVFCQLSQIL